MPQPTPRSFMGIGLESTKGTYVVPADSIPFTSLETFDNIKYLEDKGIRGSMVENYGLVQGPAYSEITFAGDVFPECLPRLVYSLMGELATSGAGAPYTHKFTTLNTGDGQGKGYSVTTFNGNNARGWPGMQVSELAFKFTGDGLMSYTCKMVGYPSAVQSTPTPSFNANPPIANWTGTLTLATVADARLEDCEITIARPTAPIHNIDGTQGPYKVWQGALTCKGKYTLIYEDDTDLTRYLTNTQPAAVVLFTVGSAGTTRQLQFTMTKCGFRDPTKVVRTKDYVQLDAAFDAIANTTDVGASGGYGPVQVQFQSAVTAYTT